MGPIRTKYNGIEYRSRVEARYAAFWDWLGWKFIYEPLDGDGYIPDFLIDGEQPLLVEVKAAQTREEYEAEVPKVVAGLERHWAWDFLIVGYGPLIDFDDVMSGDGVPIAGLLSDRNGWADVGPGHWFRCGECRRDAVLLLPQDRRGAL